MQRIFVYRLIVALTASVTATGCGSSSAPAPANSSSSGSPASVSSASTVSTRPSSTLSSTASVQSRSPALSSSYSSQKQCLLTVSEVSSALDGTWQRSNHGSGKCTYPRDRGAIFAIEPIPAPPSELGAALADARVHNCGGAKLHDVTDTGGGFVCVEHPASGDLVEGNILARGYFWLLVAPGVGSNRTYPAQSDAIAGLLRAPCADDGPARDQVWADTDRPVRERGQRTGKTFVKTDDELAT